MDIIYKKTCVCIHFFISFILYFSNSYAQAPDTLWTKTFGGIDSDGGYAVQQTLDSGYIAVGWTHSSGTGNYDIYMIKADSLGDTLWTRKYGGADLDRAYAVQQIFDGGYIAAGRTLSFGAGSADVWLLRLAAEPGIKERASFQNATFLEIHPNPFHQTTKIKFQDPGIKNQASLKIYDVTGHVVRDFDNITGHYLLGHITWAGKDKAGVRLSSGVYFLEYKLNDFAMTRKLILMR